MDIGRFSFFNVIVLFIFRQCLVRFGDQGGYLEVVVRPMLQQGHEGELCGWLKKWV